MARHRMLAPIVSIKHMVQRPNTGIVANTIANIVIAEAQNAPAAAATPDVLQGSVIKAVFVEMWLLPQGNIGSNTQFVLVVEKRSGNSPVMTGTNILNLQAYDNKKNILFTSQGVIGDSSTNAVPIIRNWIKIPRGKQRMGQGDTLMMNIISVAEISKTCGLFIYKEYR